MLHAVRHDGSGGSAAGSLSTAPLAAEYLKQIGPADTPMTELNPDDLPADLRPDAIGWECWPVATIRMAGPRRRYREPVPAEGR